LDIRTLLCLISKWPLIFVILRELSNLHNQLPLVNVNMKQNHRMRDYRKEA
jgi:hypothetical protein